MDFSIDHIFFPTDFSKNAERAFPFAAEIALNTGAKITLFHASQQTMDMAPNFEKTKEQVIDDSSQHFDELLSSFEDKRYKNLDISTVIQDGQTVTALLNQVKEHEVDLIVMGTKGVTGDRNAIFGSVASSVIQKAPVPVLAVPNGSSLDNFKNIIFTTDYKDGDPEALQQTISFAGIFDSEVKVLHVSEQKNIDSEIRFRGFRELVTNQTDYDKIVFYHEYDLDFFPTVGEFIIDHPDSLLVMVRYQKTFWEKLTERDHSKEMAFYSKIPLLVLLGESDINPATIFQTVDKQTD